MFYVYVSLKFNRFKWMFRNLLYIELLYFYFMYRGYNVIKIIVLFKGFKFIVYKIVVLQYQSFVLNGKEIVYIQNIQFF